LTTDAPTFWSHFRELRNRLVKSLVGVSLGAAVAYWKWESLWAWIAGPITRQKLDVTFIATSPMETVVTSFKLSLITGLFLSFPWITWQAWRFLAPGLYRNERRLFLGAFLSFVVMFVIGAAFCYYAVLPAGLSFLANYMDGAVTQSWRQATYAAFIIQFLLAFGVIFELPVAVFLLARLDLITARGMWGFFRYAIVIIFVVAALLTPGPDPVSQLLMALPLIALYGVSIGVCAVATRKGGPWLALTDATLTPGDKP
jgi:sec-independent protein translocase protein TatC